MKKEVGQNIDELAINNLRVLSCEMIQRANSGHPGIALGAAPMMWALFSRHLRVDPKDPEWSNRDRFVLPDMDRHSYMQCFTSAALICRLMT